MTKDERQIVNVYHILNTHNFSGFSLFFFLYHRQNFRKAKSIDYTDIGQPIFREVQSPKFLKMILS